jgi:hypothetical protein
VIALTQGLGKFKYKLNASAGQKMEITFNVLPPGEDTAIFAGSRSGNQFAGVLPKQGEYIVDVCLMRNAARRIEPASRPNGAGPRRAAPGQYAPDSLSCALHSRQAVLTRKPNFSAPLRDEMRNVRIPRPEEAVCAIRIAVFLEHAYPEKSIKARLGRHG